MDSCTRRCEECKDWTRSCFACRFSVLQEDQGLSLEVDQAQMNEITGLEFLTHNPIHYRQPQLDFTYQERVRTPATLRNNEPLARSVMSFGDSTVFAVSQELAVHVYLEAMIAHNGLNALNARVCALLVFLNCDAQALSFLNSSIQWPTMRFTKEIWLECLDSPLEQVCEIESLPLYALICLAVVKARVVARFKTNQDKLQVFLSTGEGVKVQEVQLVLADMLGYSEMQVQERQFREACDSVDRNNSEILGALAGLVQMDQDEKHGQEEELVGEETATEKCILWETLSECISRDPNVVQLFRP